MKVSRWDIAWTTGGKVDTITPSGYGGQVFTFTYPGGKLGSIATSVDNPSDGVAARTETVDFAALTVKWDQGNGSWQVIPGTRLRPQLGLVTKKTYSRVNNSGTFHTDPSTECSTAISRYPASVSFGPATARRCWAAPDRSPQLHRHVAFRGRGDMVLCRLSQRLPADPVASLRDCVEGAP